IDRRLADAPAAREPLPQPDDARKRIDHAETIGAWSRDQQPAIIGAKIDRRIGWRCAGTGDAMAGDVSVRQTTVPLTAGTRSHVVRHINPSLRRRTTAP